MRGVSLPGNMHYIGGDIVRELVALNSARFQSPRRTFIELDIIDGPLPTADAWLCRDALIHFPYSAGIAVLSKFRSSSIKYFLGTTYTNVENRRDIPFGMWRPINLVVHPFNLGEPFELIADSRSGREQHRYLGVWRNPKSLARENDRVRMFFSRRRSSATARRAGGSRIDSERMAIGLFSR